MKIPLSDLQHRLEFRHPDGEELKQINQYRPRGIEPYISEELFVFPIYASDNLLFHSLGTWSPEILETMTATYSESKDLILDHDSSDGRKIMGFTWDAQLWHFPYLSPTSIDKLLITSVNARIDRKILAKDGLQQIMLWGAIEASHPISSEIRYRRKADVSTGGLVKNYDYICPICSTPENKVSFQNEVCPHYPPTEWSSTLVEWGELDASTIAPYYIRDGFHFSTEISLVLEGNCPRASLIAENLNNLVLV